MMPLGMSPFVRVLATTTATAVNVVFSSIGCAQIGFVYYLAENFRHCSPTHTPSVSFLIPSHLLCHINSRRLILILSLSLLCIRIVHSHWFLLYQTHCISNTHAYSHFGFSICVCTTMYVLESCLSVYAIVYVYDVRAKIANRLYAKWKIFSTFVQNVRKRYGEI